MVSDRPFPLNRRHDFSDIWQMGKSANRQIELWGKGSAPGLFEPSAHLPKVVFCSLWLLPGTWGLVPLIRRLFRGRQDVQAGGLSGLLLQAGLKLLQEVPGRLGKRPVALSGLIEFQG